MNDPHGGYKALDMVSFFSAILGGISVLGLVAGTWGPWADPNPSPVPRLVFNFGWIMFWMIGMVARSASAQLGQQADEIAELRRQLSERQPAG